MTTFFGIFVQEKLIAAAGLFYNDNEYEESAEILHLQNYRVAEIGRIMTHPEYQHKGYMNMILSEIIKYARTRLLDYLIATVHSQNAPSYKALKKIGMYKEAHCIKHETYERDILVLELN
jgi:RimJ/RimL family protein N-acetyltransferase